MARHFDSGDFLLFQLESGFGLLRVLLVDDSDAGAPVWHLRAYEDLFLDADSAEAALTSPESLRTSIEHMALTNRAFERTPTAKLLNRPLSEDEIAHVKDWNSNADRVVSDRSVLLMLGLR